MWRIFAIAAVFLCIVSINLVQSLKCQVGTYSIHSGTSSIVNGSAHHLHKALVFHNGYNDEVEEATCEVDENSCMRHEITGNIMEEGDVTGR